MPAKTNLRPPCVAWRHQYTHTQPCSALALGRILSAVSSRSLLTLKLKNQIGRRNLPTYVKAQLALKLKPALAEQAKENERLGGKGSQKSVNHKTDTQKELARIAGVSHDTIHKVEPSNFITF